MRNKFLVAACLLFSSFIFNACNKEDDDNSKPVITDFAATLSGANETPPNGSLATGTANFSFNGDTKILSGTVTYSGLTPIAAHIHSGASGEAGGVEFPLGETSLASPISFTSVPLDASQEADLMNGLYYVNIHTAAYPDGEIRGQLTKQ